MRESHNDETQWKPPHAGSYPLQAGLTCRTPGSTRAATWLIDGETNPHAIRRIGAEDVFGLHGDCTSKRLQIQSIEAPHGGTIACEEHDADPHFVAADLRFPFPAGEQPPELCTLPTGSEIAQPARRCEADQEDVVSPDPKNQVFRDFLGLVRIDVAVVPPRIKPGESARVHVTLRPDVSRKVHWNNEGEPLQLWVDMPPRWQVQRRLLKAPQGDKPETTETRHLEFEVQSAADAGGKVKLAACALYYVCEDIGETRRFLRQDIPVSRKVGLTE